MKRYEQVLNHDEKPLTSLPIPPWDVRFMLQAYRAARGSKDLKTKIGAVLVKDKIPLLSGYNGMPRKVNDNVPERQERPRKYHYFSHAEENIFTNACREGICTKDSTLYVFIPPCTTCTRMIINAGVTRLVLHQAGVDLSKKLHSGQESWRDTLAESQTMLYEARIQVDYLDEYLSEFCLIDGFVYLV